MSEVTKVTRFIGPHRFLSNFYVHPLDIDGVVYKSAEHAYQSAKTEDPEWRERIMAAETPGKAKELGRQCPLRPGWEELKLAVMHCVVECKFTVTDYSELVLPPGPPAKSLAARLLATRNADLSEGNYHGDVYWGVDLMTGKGKNWLGKLLTLQRSFLFSARLYEMEKAGKAGKVSSGQEESKRLMEEKRPVVESFGPGWWERGRPAKLRHVLRICNGVGHTRYPCTYCIDRLVNKIVSLPEQEPDNWTKFQEEWRREREQGNGGGDAMDR